MYTWVVIAITIARVKEVEECNFDGIGTVRKSERAIVVELSESEGTRLSEAIEDTEKTLLANRELLVEVSRLTTIALQIGWTPRRGQDGVVFGADLLQLLAEIKAPLVVNTYTDDDDDD